MSDEYALVAEIKRLLDEPDRESLNPERDLEAGLVSAMRAAGRLERASKRRRLADSDTPLQRHLGERFLAAQGSTGADSRARALRAENARRYQYWAETSALNATGNRPV